MFTKFKQYGDMKWIGELDIIIQIVNLTSSRKMLILLYKKVQKKHGKQLNFMYHYVLEHTRGLVRPASLWFWLCQKNIELLVAIKIQNDCDSLELIC